MKNSIYYFVSGILAVVFGIFVIVNPSFVVNALALIFSTILLIRGIRTFANTMRFDSVARRVSVHGVEINLDSRSKVRKTMVINASISALVGLVCFIVSLVAFRKNSSGIMKAMVYVVASAFLVSGITGIIENRRMREWSGMNVEIGEKTVFLLVVSLVLFVFPSLVGNVLMNILGALIIAFGALYFAWGIYIMKTEKSVKKKEAEDVSWSEKKE
ncbi:MAG: DUF308 domain-containing protein [Candidatus Ornithospirochaeta sp.]